MFRRSRFSVRPNVGTAGRPAATPQEAPSVNQEASETLKDASESSIASAVTDSSVVTSSEKPPASGDGNDQNGEGTSSSAAVQRRKRFSIKPKVAPGRPATVSRTPKSLIKAASETPVDVSGSDLDKSAMSGNTAATIAPQGLQSPRRRRPSEESKQLKVQPKPNLIHSDSSGLSAVPLVEDLLEQTHPSPENSKQLENTSEGQVKEVTNRLPDKVPPSLPDKEAIEISEKAKTLVSSKSGLSLSQPAFCLSRLLNDPSDLQRIAKARKLRELLRQEMTKEKKIKKAKTRVKEYTLDPAKMTMRDLIRYLPVSNPMTSSLEDPAPENETVVPPSPGREESPESAQEPEAPRKLGSPRGGEEEEEEEVVEEEQEEALMVPQVKVAEDGSLIIDEESLTVEVQRAKGPNPAQDRDPIFERGSTTTYSSFRKGTYSKPWSSEETDMFFLAISMVGTDFSMICQLFPHRGRSEIKNKFKKEERENAWRIDKAFRERRKLDIEYFSKLLEKILEVQKNRKKLKSLTEKNSSKKQKKKPKGKKAAQKLNNVEENEIPDLEEEGEKENEDLCNEGKAPVFQTKKRRKRKNRQDASSEEPNDKKNKTGEKSSEQDEAHVPEDAEAALPGTHTISDVSEKTDNMNVAKETSIKPAKLSRGRAPKPTLPLGRKWGKKPPAPSAKVKDTALDKGEGSVSDGASKEQVIGNKDASPTREAKERSANDEICSEEEDAPVQPLRPTRYGRVPKPTKHLTYLAKDDAHSSASETNPASPAGSTASAAKPRPKCTAKRGRSSKPQSAQESKKPKLVTLRASQSEYSDEENDKQWEEEEEEEQHPTCSYSKDSIAPVFVPASLRSPQPVISEVEETMEELDILANMPDVLGISQHALCPDASCELAQNETGTAEPCEHQLDLLVDVIDFLSTDQTDVSGEESYNEAAQTLLTIGNLAHLSQSGQTQTAAQDHATGTSVSVEAEMASKPAAQEENSPTPFMSATSCQEVTETTETGTVATVELQKSTTENSDMPIIETSDQRTSDMNPTPQLLSSPEMSKKFFPQTRRGRLSKVKPKPNLNLSSRTIQSKSQPETSTVRTAEESQSVVSDPSQATETLSAEEISKMEDCSQKLSKDVIYCSKVKLTEESSNSQENSTGQVKSGAALTDESTSENLSHCISDTKFKSSLEQATTESLNEIQISHCETVESSFNNMVTSNTIITKFKGEDIESVPVHQSGDHSEPEEDLPIKQKEGSEDASACHTRKSRFQKVKPIPNLAKKSRAALSKPQATKDTTDTYSSPTSNPKFNEKTIELDEEPICSTSPEKLSQSTGHASDLILCMDSGSAPTPAEPSSTEEKRTRVGVVGCIESGAASSDQSALENQNFSGAQFQVSEDQIIRNTKPTSESAYDKVASHVGTTGSSCSSQQVDSAPVQENIDHPAPCVMPVEGLPVNQKEESANTCTPQIRKSRFQKVKPKPNLAQTARSVRSKPQTTEDPLTGVQLVEQPFSPTSKPECTDSTVSEMEVQPTCSTSPPGKLRQIKSAGTSLVSVPSVESCSAHEPTLELPSTEGQKTDVVSAPNTSSEGSERNVAPRRRRFPAVKPNLGSSTRTVQTKPQANCISRPSEPSDKCLSSDGIVIATSAASENPCGLTDSILENKSSEKLTFEVESTNTLETGAVSQWGCRQQSASEANTQKADDPTPLSDVQSSEYNSTKTKFKFGYASSSPVSKDNNLQAQSQHALEQLSETTENNQTAVESTEENESESTDSSSSSRKPSQNRRGRLVKPKPNLGRRSQPSYSQQIQDTKQGEADAGPHPGDVDALVTQEPASGLQPDIQEPERGDIEQSSNLKPLSNDAGSSLGCLTQLPNSSSQDASTSSPGGTQNHPVVSMQVPSDPDEPFFILSLTEIPVCSLREAVDSALEPLPYLPVTDALMQQQSSISTEGLAAVGNEDSFSHSQQGSNMENPLDQNEGTTVQPLKLPETKENNDETEHPPTKQRQKGSGGTAKLPQKRGVDPVDIEKETLTVGKDHEDGNSGAQSTQTRRANSQNRNPKGFPSFLSETNTALLSGSPPKVMTPCTAEKQPTPATIPSTSFDVAPTSSQIQSPETCSTPFDTTSTQTKVDIEYTSQCTAEVSASQQSDNVESNSGGGEEEPTNVSQYFLTDIFTDVEEG